MDLVEPVQPDPSKQQKQQRRQTTEQDTHWQLRRYYHGGIAIGGVHQLRAMLRLQRCFYAVMAERGT